MRNEVFKQGSGSSSAKPPTQSVGTKRQDPPSSSADLQGMGTCWIHLVVPRHRLFTSYVQLATSRSASAADPPDLRKNNLLRAVMRVDRSDVFQYVAMML